MSTFKRLHVQGDKTINASGKGIRLVINRILSDKKNFIKNWYIKKTLTS